MKSTLPTFQVPLQAPALPLRLLLQHTRGNGPGLPQRWQLLRDRIGNAVARLRCLARRNHGPGVFQPLNTITLRDIGMRRTDTRSLAGHQERRVIQPRSIWS